LVPGSRDQIRIPCDYYATEFLDARRKRPTPYMERLNFEPASDAPDHDHRVLTDDQLTEAEQEADRVAV
jgi:hypothetical protein